MVGFHVHQNVKVELSHWSREVGFIERIARCSRLPQGIDPRLRLHQASGIRPLIYNSGKSVSCATTTAVLVCAIVTYFKITCNENVMGRYEAVFASSTHDWYCYLYASKKRQLQQYTTHILQEYTITKSFLAIVARY